MLFNLLRRPLHAAFACVSLQSVELWRCAAVVCCVRWRRQLPGGEAEPSPARFRSLTIPERPKQAGGVRGGAFQRNEFPVVEFCDLVSAKS